MNSVDTRKSTQEARFSCIIYVIYMIYVRHLSKPTVIFILATNPTRVICVVRHFCTSQTSGSTSRAVIQIRMQTASSVKCAA